MTRRSALPTPLLAVFAVLISSISALVFAAPRVIEETSRFPAPPGLPCFATAMDGNRLVCASSGTSAGTLDTHSVDLYERDAAGRWAHVAELMTVTGPVHGLPIKVALQGNIAALALRDSLHISELTSSGWLQSSLSRPSQVGALGPDVAISNGTIVAAGLTDRLQGVVFRKNASGTWQNVAVLNAGLLPPSSGFTGDVDISGARIVIGSPYYDPQTDKSSGTVFVFDEANGAWNQVAEIVYPFAGETAPGFGAFVDLEGDMLVLRDSGPYDLHLFVRTAGVWSHAKSLHDADVFSRGGPVDIDGNLIVQAFEDSDRTGNVGSLMVYERSGTDLRAVARLYGRELMSTPIGLLGIEGRTVYAANITLGQPFTLNFALPADLSQPANFLDNFEDGNANDWTPSQVSHWTVVASGGSRVYRQTSFATESHTVVTDALWTNQSIQAEITPTATEGSERWFGLAVRLRNASNFYYVSLRSSNTVQLRKKVNGAYTTLASAPFVFQLNRRYQVRVEAIGSRIRAYVNGVPMLEAVDRSHTQGRAGLITSRVRADFDNVIVTPNPLRRLFTDSFSGDDTSHWIKAAGEWVDPPGPTDPEEPDPYVGLRNFFQASTAGRGRAIAGVPTDDMIVEATARATSPLTSGWFGVMGRYVDENNFYYLRLGENTVSLRKMVNGLWVELASVPFALSSNVTYSLRLEIVGTSLRGHVNGRFLVEATDSSYAEGRYGLGTNFTAARFDDFRVHQP